MVQVAKSESTYPPAVSGVAKKEAAKQGMLEVRRRSSWMAAVAPAESIVRESIGKQGMGRRTDDRSIFPAGHVVNSG